MANSSKLPDLGHIGPRDTLGDQAYKNLRRALMTGRLSPGEKLTVRGIADALSVSLTPAREAIGRLVSERALDHGPNRTVIVPEVGVDEYQELLDIRLMLECKAAEEAARRFTNRDIDRLQNVQERMVESISNDKPKQALALNEDFHFLIYRASQRPMLVSMIEGLWLRVGPVMNLLTPRYQRSYQGARNHANALEAARRRDGAALRAAIEKDLTDGATHVLKLLEEAGKQARDASETDDEE